MGAVTYSLDRKLVNAIQSVLPVSILVEAGTYKGDTIEATYCCFEQIISIELSEIHWKEAFKRFENNSNILIINGSSHSILTKIKQELSNSSVLYWLDAHWCVDASISNEISQCRLLDELESISSLNDKSIILIDDARLFLAPPLPPHELSQWPSFNNVVRALQSMSSIHEIMVVNDVIIFFPPVARESLNDFARSNGFDWLHAVNFFKNYNSLENTLAEKEFCIHSQKEALEVLSSELVAKEKVIQEQKRVFRIYSELNNIFPIFKTLGKFLLRFIEVFRPRLGNFYQYQPRPMTRLEPVKVELANIPLTISIVTPSFQQGLFIDRTIRSVIDQAYPFIEYYVQDGDSSDDTVEVIKSFQNKISGWVSEKDNGQSQAINRGFMQTKGEIMGWLNSDDLLLPGALQTVANYFNAHPEVDVLYGDRLIIDENDMEIGRWLMPGHDNFILSWADYIPQETLFWRRSIWERIGGEVDETFMFAMDWDLLVRFREAGAKFVHIPRFLGAFRIHEKQKTSSLIHQAGRQEMDRIRQRLLGHIPTQKELYMAILPFLLKHVLVDLKFRLVSKLSGFLR